MHSSDYCQAWWWTLLIQNVSAEKGKHWDEKYERLYMRIRKRLFFWYILFLFSLLFPSFSPHPFFLLLFWTRKFHLDLRISKMQIIYPLITIQCLQIASFSFQELVKKERNERRECIPAKKWRRTTYIQALTYAHRKAYVCLIFSKSSRKKGCWWRW